MLVNTLINKEEYLAGKTGRKEENNADNLTGLSPSRQKIYMLTAPIQSGKTTSLINWSADRNDVHGILTPVINGKRVFMNAHTKEQFYMEAEEGETEILKVGRFVFSKNNFDKAIQVIRNAINKQGWLIIDEIGPLELNGEGFYSVLREAIASNRQKLLLVVRDKEDVLEKVKQIIGDNTMVIHRHLNTPDFL